MTGRDLIVYILENNLENAPVFANGKFIGCMTVEEVAVRFNVGVETVKAWYELGYIKGVKTNNELYILANSDVKIYTQE